MYQELDLSDSQLDYEMEQILAKRVATSEYKPCDWMDPTPIRWQHQLYYDIHNDEIQYCEGAHTILLSGAVGSAKSAMAAKMLWEHLIKYAGAEACLGRETMKNLRASNLKTFLKMAPSNFREGIEYVYNRANYTITLSNGSMVDCLSWNDGKYDKFKSRSYSFYHIEEATESGDIDFWLACNQRGDRNPYIPVTYIVLTTNPDEPEHPIYTDIICKARYVDGQRQEGPSDLLNDNIHVYYSTTKDNVFMKNNYYENQCKIYSWKQIERFLHGKWISLAGTGVYYEYRDTHYIKENYVVNPNHPIYICWDFNVAKGKPMSVCFAQYIGGIFYFFNELLAECDTLQMCQAIADHKDGLLDHNTEYIITGDATGWSRDSTSSWSDYDIIKKFLENYKTKRKDTNGNHVPMKHKMAFGKTVNPSVRKRHQLVNSYMMTADGISRLFVYAPCVKLNAGFKLVQLKDKATYIEDDSKDYQHVTTAAGYCIWWATRKPGTVEYIDYH